MEANATPTPLEIEVQIDIAPTGRAVRELAEEASVAAWTLDRALLDLRDGHALPERTVVLLDDAGTASTRAPSGYWRPPSSPARR